jgi:hypothetical protein
MWVCVLIGAAGILEREWTFRELTPAPRIDLRGTQGETVVDFGGRRDEVVTAATLDLEYEYSPALLPTLSQLKIYLNEELVRVLPLDPGKESGRQRRTLELDPRFFTDFNHLRFVLVGHYTDNCEDPAHSALWLEISRQSRLRITSRALTLQNDLSYFPLPFFDPRDFSRLELPIILPQRIDRDTLRSAGILASYFGMHSDWRGAHFPAVSELPAQHAVAFATNQVRPAFLAEHPAFMGPLLEMVSHPEQPFLKILLVAGRGAADLRQAVMGLVLGAVGLAGHATSVEQVVVHRPREPYDAPRWVSTKRKTKFVELVTGLDELQVSGYRPRTIRLTMRVPADLFTWQSRGIPIDLRYRYTPPAQRDESRLSISINDQFVESFNLQDSGRGGLQDRVRVPLDGGLWSDSSEFFIPGFKVGSQNVLEFQYSFGQLRAGACQGQPLYNTRAVIDADSTIDLSGFPHYAALPNLRYFVDSGYPFTRMADLSETTFVLAAAAGAVEQSVFFDAMGRLGAATGYPGVAVSLATPDALSAQRDKDIIYISATAPSAGDDLARFLGDARGMVREPARAALPHVDQTGYGVAVDSAPAAEVALRSQGSLAGLVGFESPVSAGRSVVAWVAGSEADLQRLMGAVQDPAQSHAIFGSVAVLRGAAFDSRLVGATYHSGELPPWTLVWFTLSSHPVWLGLLGALAVLLLAFLLWRALTYVAARRLRAASP